MLASAIATIITAIVLCWQATTTKTPWRSENHYLLLRAREGGKRLPACIPTTTATATTTTTKITTRQPHHYHQESSFIATIWRPLTRSYFLLEPKFARYSKRWKIINDCRSMVGASGSNNNNSKNITNMTHSLTPFQPTCLVLLAVVSSLTNDLLAVFQRPWLV